MSPFRQPGGLREDKIESEKININKNMTDFTGKFLIITFSAPDRKKALVPPVKSEQLEIKYRGILIIIAYKKIII